MNAHDAWGIAPAAAPVWMGISPEEEGILRPLVGMGRRAAGAAEERPTVRRRMRGPIAILGLTGPLFRRPNLLTELRLGTSTEEFTLELGAALRNPTVTGIVVDVDSPGGQIAGALDVAEIIRRGLRTKPIVAHLSGEASSIAYSIAAAASRVQVAPTAMVSAIGIATAVTYRRGPDPSGRETVHFVSSVSPRKLIDPTTDQGAADVQAVVDALAQVLLSATAKYRGIPESRLLATEGRTLVGAEVVHAGLADGVGTTRSAARWAHHPNPAEGTPTRSSGPPPTVATPAAVARAAEARARVALEEEKARRRRSVRSILDAGASRDPAAEPEIQAKVRHLLSAGRSPNAHPEAAAAADELVASILSAGRRR